MNPEIDKVGAAILKGACNAESKDVVVDLGQLGLAELFDESVLKEIPVIKTVVACFKVPLAIRDQLFIRKVSGFLGACPDFSETEKTAFINEHLGNTKKATKLGETLVLILDRLDDMEKPEMVAKMFAAFVRGKINLDVFRRLASAIDLGSVDDLREFVVEQPPQSQGGPPLVTSKTQLLRTNLVRTGLVSLPPFRSTVPILNVSFNENDLGKIFKEIMKGQ